MVAELGLGSSIHEMAPGTGEKNAFVLQGLRDFHLPSNFIRREKVIRVEPLNIVAPAKLKRFIPCRRRALVFLSDDGYRIRNKLARDCERFIPGAVIYNDNFLVRPSLTLSGFYSVRDPSLGVIGWNEDGNQRLHETTQGRRIFRKIGSLSANLFGRGAQTGQAGRPSYQDLVSGTNFFKLIRARKLAFQQLAKQMSNRDVAFLDAGSICGLNGD